MELMSPKMGLTSASVGSRGSNYVIRVFFSPSLSFLFSVVYVGIIFSIKDLPACSQEEDRQSPIPQQPCLAVAVQREFLSPNFHRLILGIESNWSCYVSRPLLRPLNFQGKLSCHTTRGGSLHTEIYVSGSIWRLSRACCMVALLPRIGYYEWIGLCHVVVLSPGGQCLFSEKANEGKNGVPK